MGCRCLSAVVAPGIPRGLPALGRAAERRNVGRRAARWILLRVLFWYVVIVALIGFFQRSLMYFPGRAERIDPAEAGLPEGAVHDIVISRNGGYPPQVLSEVRNLRCYRRSRPNLRRPGHHYLRAHPLVELADGHH